MGYKCLSIVTPKEFGKDRVKQAYEEVLRIWKKPAPELGYVVTSPAGRHYFLLQLEPYSDCIELSKR